MKRFSIGVRLALWYLAIFALGEFVFGAGVWMIIRHNLYDMVDDAVESQVDDLQTFLRAQSREATIADLRHAMSDKYSTEHAGEYLALYAENGEPVYSSTFLQAHQSVLLPYSEVKRPSSRSRRIGHTPYRFLFQKLAVNGHVFAVEMGIPADDAVETLQLFKSYLLMFAPVLLLVAAAVGYWLSRRALSPVDELVRTAREISGSNLSGRLQKLDTGDELQRLSDTLNEMLDRIETSFQRVTEFTADASHELRTPVALIRTEAELALRRSRGPAEYQEALRHILVESERTTALIEQLLSLARADSGRENLQLQPVNLRPLLRSVSESWEQVAAISEIHFSANIPQQDAVVMGDETLLRRLADILLDNAFKYTPRSGSVSLVLEPAGGTLRLTLEDTGIGIAEQDHSKIFERFYRVDKARSRSQGGAGLGLAIARWIVTQHRGTIAVAESRPGEGSKFRVELPLISTPALSPQPA